MYQPPIVKFPVFSVTWAEATDDDGSCTPAVVAAGGGGSGKTGISNKIVRFSLACVLELVCYVRRQQM